MSRGYVVPCRRSSCSRSSTTTSAACSRRSMHERAAAVGEMLFRAGEPGDSMFIVQTGAVELFVKDTAGQKIVLHTARARRLLRRAVAARRRIAHRERDGRRGGDRCSCSIARTCSQLFRKRPDAALDMLAAMGADDAQGERAAARARRQERQRGGRGGARQHRAARRRLGRELLGQHHVPRPPRRHLRGVDRASTSACFRSATSIRSRSAC